MARGGALFGVYTQRGKGYKYGGRSYLYRAAVRGSRLFQVVMAQKKVVRWACEDGFIRALTASTIAPSLPRESKLQNHELLSSPTKRANPPTTAPRPRAPAERGKSRVRRRITRFLMYRKPRSPSMFIL
jgi:hypothetical protein